MALNKYIPAAQPEEEQQKLAVAIERQIDAALALVNQKDEFDARQAELAKWDKSGKKVDEVIAHRESVEQFKAQAKQYADTCHANPFFAKISASKQRILTETDTPDEQKTLLANEVVDLKSQAQKAVFDDKTPLLSDKDAVAIKDFLPDFSKLGEVAANAAENGIKGAIFGGGATGGILAGTFSAVKTSVQEGIWESLVKFVRHFFKDMLMNTGGAETAKSLMSGLPEWAGGEGKKKTEAQCKDELVEQQAALRLVKEGIIALPIGDDGKMVNTQATRAQAASLFAAAIEKEIKTPTETPEAPSTPRSEKDSSAATYTDTPDWIKELPAKVQESLKNQSNVAILDRDGDHNVSKDEIDNYLRSQNIILSPQQLTDDQLGKLAAQVTDIIKPTGVAAPAK